MISSENIINLKDIEKSYNSFNLTNINFNVTIGEMVYIVGSNGSGKSTLLKIISNQILPSSGTINSFSQRNNVNRGNMFFMNDELMLLYDLNIKDVGIIFNNIYPSFNINEYKEYCRIFKLHTNTNLKKFSKGMRVLLNFSLAFSSGAKLIILDESLSGLDMFNMEFVLEKINEKVKDKKISVILSTHIIEDISEFGNRIILLKDGKIILDEYIKNLYSKYNIIETDEENFKKISANKNIKILGYSKKNCKYKILIESKEIGINKSYKLKDLIYIILNS